jgi:actin-related protein
LYIKLKGTSVIIPQTSVRVKYLLTFEVLENPSATINANIGNASLPTHVIHSIFPANDAHRWSSSIKNIAIIWSWNDVNFNLFIKPSFFKT